MPWIQSVFCCRSVSCEPYFGQGKLFLCAPYNMVATIHCIQIKLVLNSPCFLTVESPDIMKLILWSWSSHNVFVKAVLLNYTFIRFLNYHKLSHTLIIILISFEVEELEANTCIFTFYSHFTPVGRGFVPAGGLFSFNWTSYGRNYRFL